MSGLSTKPALIANYYIKISFIHPLIFYIGRQLASSTGSLLGCHLISADAIQLLKFFTKYF
jgi:hypothetical protein